MEKQLFILQIRDAKKGNFNLCSIVYTKKEILNTIIEAVTYGNFLNYVKKLDIPFICNDEIRKIDFPDKSNVRFFADNGVGELYGDFSLIVFNKFIKNIVSKTDNVIYLKTMNYQKIGVCQDDFIALR